MVTASQLRPGTILKIGEDLFRVVESAYHVGQGKMPGSVHASLRHVRKGSFKELRFRPEDRLEDVALERQEMEFLYSDADSATFMHPRTYDQVSVPLEFLAGAEQFLKSEMKISVDFYEGEPVNVIFPQIVEVKVDSTSDPVHQQADNTYKPAVLENGLKIMVPQFIKTGDLVRVEVATRKFVDRVRMDAKRV
ncbi:MAG: elongation factor P [Acidobacteria bacterium]|nr:elongation factor P [Acidobacteriota bacterium]